MLATDRSRFAAIVALALAVRACWAIAVPVVPLSDSNVYDVLARNIASGVGYAFEPGKPSAYWPVGTSAVYAGLYRVFGVGYAPILVLNVLVGGLTVALVMTLAGRWYGPRAGRYAGLVLALWPGQVMFSSILASELLFNLGWLAALYFFGRKDWPAALRVPLVAAVLAGTSFVRPLALPMPVIFAWFCLAGSLRKPPWSWRSLLGIGAEAGITLALMLAMLAPWAERNRRGLGEAVLVSTNGGANLWMGNNPNTNGGYCPLPPEVESLNEAVRDRLLKNEAIAYIKARPLAFVGRTAKKAVQTYDRETIGVTWNEEGLTRRYGAFVLMPLKAICTAYWWGMLALGGIGMICVWKRSGFWGWISDPAIVLWFYFGALHAVIVSGDRYHYPSTPLIAALAGLALATWKDRRPGNTTDLRDIPV